MKLVYSTMKVFLVLLFAVSLDAFTLTLTTPTEAKIRASSSLFAKESSSSEDLISDFCQGTNEFWRNLVIEPVRNYVDVLSRRRTLLLHWLITCLID